MIKHLNILVISGLMAVCFVAPVGAIERSYNPDRSSNVFGMNSSGRLGNRYYSREHTGNWGISSSRIYGTDYGAGIRRSYFSSSTVSGGGGQRRYNDASRGYRTLTDSEIQAMEDKMYSGKVLP